MDPSTKDYISSEFRKLHTLIANHTDTDLTNHQQTTAAIRELKDAIGSLPPPRMNGSAEPITTRVSKVEGSASSANLNIEELRSEIILIRNELKSQSSMMAIGYKGWKYLASPEGKKTILSVIATIGASIAATLEVYRSLKGH
jgi:hypothetical protein